MTTEAKWSDFASMDGAKMLAAANRLLPAWVSLLLVIVIAWQLARIIWMLVPGPSAGDAISAPANVLSSATRTDGSANVQEIVAAHVFGVANALLVLWIGSFKKHFGWIAGCGDPANNRVAKRG